MECMVLWQKSGRGAECCSSTDFDYCGCFFISAWKPKDDEPLSKGNHYNAESIWNDLVQYAILADYVGCFLCTGWCTFHGADTAVVYRSTFSGVIATILFFEATSLVKNNPKQLAVIEATQSGEVIFTLLGGLLFLGDTMPTAVGFAGVAVVVVGMIVNSLI